MTTSAGIAGEPRRGGSRAGRDVPGPPSIPCPTCKGAGEVVDLGAQIRAARIAKGMTQHELAEKVGVWSPTTVCHWEKGHTKPRPGHRRKLREVLELHDG